MQLREWIALGQAGALAAVGMFFAYRLENLRKTFSRSLKRYDLLHTARFKVVEEADDRLVDVQLAEFEAWKLLQRRRFTTIDEKGWREIDDSLLALRQVVHAAAIRKIKCEKYFDTEFNNQFAELLGKLQDAEMSLQGVQNLRILIATPEQENEAIGKMNEACRVSKAAIPAFRKRLGELFQNDVG